MKYYREIFIAERRYRELDRKWLWSGRAELIFIFIYLLNCNGALKWHNSKLKDE